MWQVVLPSVVGSPLLSPTEAVDVAASAVEEAEEVEAAEVNGTFTMESTSLTQLATLLLLSLRLLDLLVEPLSSTCVIAACSASTPLP